MNPAELRKWADAIREDSVIPRLVVAENVRVAAADWDRDIEQDRRLRGVLIDQLAASAQDNVYLADGLREGLGAADETIAALRNGIAVLGEKNAKLQEAYDELGLAYETLRSGIRSLWHGVVDGDMDRISTGYALKELFR